PAARPPEPRAAALGRVARRAHGAGAARRARGRRGPVHRDREAGRLARRRGAPLRARHAGARLDRRGAVPARAGPLHGRRHAARPAAPPHGHRARQPRPRARPRQPGQPGDPGAGGGRGLVMLQRFVAQHRRLLALIAGAGAATHVINIVILSERWYAPGVVTAAGGAALLTPPVLGLAAFWLLAYEHWMRGARSRLARRAQQAITWLFAVAVAAVLV